MSALVIGASGTVSPATHDTIGEVEGVRGVGLQAPWLVNRLAGVSPEDDQSGLRPIARYDPEGTDLDAIACVADEHIIVYVTGLAAGRREVIGLEIHPLRDPAAPETVKWLDTRMRRALESVAGAGGRQPVSANLVRQLPFSTLLSLRSESPSVESLVDAARGRMALPMPDASELSEDDRRRLPYLDDAETYAIAASEGVAPAAVIAEARGIAHGTATNRIARARALGLLTPSGRQTFGGELTPDAVRLLAWRKG